MKKNISTKSLNILLSAVTSILMIAILITSLLSISHLLVEDDIIITNASIIFYAVTFGLLSILQIPLFIIHNEQKKRIKCPIYIALYIVAIFLIVLVKKDWLGLKITSTLYYLSIIIGRVITIIDTDKKRKKVSSAIYIFIALILAIVGLKASDDTISVACILLPSICIMLITFTKIFKEALAKIQLAKLKDIIQRTYAIEILLGLISLIVSFSYIFTLLSEISYGDALWYSFSLVTTIGFGDVVITDPISRVLSVFLGIYGIIVVGVITSILVNFYNETKFIGKKDAENNSEPEEQEPTTKEEPPKEDIESKEQP